MNDLFTETITSVKQIDNFFLEFENHFAFSFQDIDLEIHQNDINFQSDDERIKYIIDERLFEKCFNWIRKKIINHLNYQLEKKDDSISSILFLQRQVEYSIKYKPERRKVNLVNDYKVYYIANGDESILNEEYLYSDYEKEILKKSFQVYSLCYDKTRIKVARLLKLFEQPQTNLIEEKQKKLLQNERMPLLFEKLNEIGFFSLDKIKQLNESQKKAIIELIKTKNNMPYTIALFHHIGFIDHLEQHVFSKKDKLYKKLSSILNIDKSGRTVRGLINSLKPVSNENISKYTAHIHILDATEDFKSIIEEEI